MFSVIMNPKALGCAVMLKPSLLSMYSFLNKANSWVFYSVWKK